MLVLDLASSALVAQSIYYYLIPHFGATFQFDSVTPGLSAECLLSGIMTFISQMYFVHQLHTVKHLGTKVHRLVIVIIAIFAILAFLGGTSCVIAMYLFKHGVLSNRNTMFGVFFGLAKGFGAITDIIATVAMCIFLSSRKTGMEGTNSMIKSLVNFIVQRGVLVTLIQTLLLITFYAIPTRLHWFALHMNVTKLYANTFFAILNARDHLKEKRMNLKSPYNTSSSHLQGKHDESFSIVAQENDGSKSYPMQPMPSVTKTVLIQNM